MKILAITLARGGSKGVPKKNIKKLCGLPLIAYTINEAAKVFLIDRYIISTDDIEIKKIAEKYGAEVPFLRPAALSQDTSSSVSALQHAVNWAENDQNIKYDYIVELMCTNPFKTNEDIDACIRKIIRTNADSVIAVHKLDDHHPARIKKIVDDRIEDFCIQEIPESRRQDLKPDAYIRSGSIYVVKRDHLMLENRRYGSVDSRPYVLSSNNVINIDSELDFIVAESILKKRKKLK